MKQKYVLIVAGGSGTRMGTEVPKQFLPIGGKPVLMRTIEAFCACFGRDIRTILVLPSSQQGYWDRLCREHRFSLPCDVADGGATRFHSVCNGLKLVRERAALVGVHDGVRPFVSASVIRQCYAVAERYGAAVPVVPVVESMRCLQGGGHSIAVNREHYRLGSSCAILSRSFWRSDATQSRQSCMQTARYGAISTTRQRCSLMQSVWDTTPEK